jgi:hypothetical protein
MDSEQQSGLLLFEHVREILSEAKNLSKMTCELIDFLNDKDTIGTDTPFQVKLALETGSKIISEHGPQINEHFVALKNIFAKYPTLSSKEGGDTTGDIALMRVKWDIICWDWPKTSDLQTPTMQDILVRMQAVAQALGDLIKRGEIVTFPDLVNERLRDMRTSECLNFFDTFSEEFNGDQEPLKLAWAYLQKHSLLINGILVEPGLIYRASSSVARRVLSPIIINAFVLAGACILLLLNISAVFPGDPTVLLRGYAAIIIGGLAHTLVEVFKQYRLNNEKTIALLDNWLMWVHIREIKIIGGIILLWAGYLMYVYLGYAKDWQAAFFVGYSIDSFIDLFLVRFTGIASQRIGSTVSQFPQKTPTRQSK